MVALHTCRLRGLAALVAGAMEETIRLRLLALLILVAVAALILGVPAEAAGLALSVFAIFVVRLEGKDDPGTA